MNGWRKLRETDHWDCIQTQFSQRFPNFELKKVQPAGNKKCQLNKSLSPLLPCLFTVSKKKAPQCQNVWFQIATQSLTPAGLLCFSNISKNDDKSQLQNNCFQSVKWLWLVIGYSKKHGGRCYKFWQVCFHCNNSTCSHYRRHVKGATLESQAPYALEQPHRRDFRKMIVQYFTEELCIQSFRVTRSTSDEFCNAMGPLVAPAASSLGEQAAIN